MDERARRPLLAIAGSGEHRGAYDIFDNVKGAVLASSSKRYIRGGAFLTRYQQRKPLQIFIDHAENLPQRMVQRFRQGESRKAWQPSTSTLPLNTDLTRSEHRRRRKTYCRLT